MKHSSARTQFILHPFYMPILSLVEPGPVDLIAITLGLALASTYESTKVVYNML